MPGADLEEPEPIKGSRVLLLGMSLSGAAALINEVGWTRVLSLTLGPTTYAFTLMLCAMIAGIGLGAAIGSTWARRRSVRLSTFAWIEILIGASSLALVPAFGRLTALHWTTRCATHGFFRIDTDPRVPAHVRHDARAHNASRNDISRGFGVYARSNSFLGSRVSAVYAANTVGGIVGSLGGRIRSDPDDRFTIHADSCRLDQRRRRSSRVGRKPALDAFCGCDRPGGRRLLDSEMEPAVDGVRSV